MPQHQRGFSRCGKFFRGNVIWQNAPARVEQPHTLPSLLQALQCGQMRAFGARFSGQIAFRGGSRLCRSPAGATVPAASCGKKTILAVYGE